jgi:hypothetical protein
MAAFRPEAPSRAQLGAKVVCNTRSFTPISSFVASLVLVIVSLSTTRVYGDGEVTVALPEIEGSSLVL